MRPRSENLGLRGSRLVSRCFVTNQTARTGCICIKRKHEILLGCLFPTASVGTTNIDLRTGCPLPGPSVSLRTLTGRWAGWCVNPPPPYTPPHPSLPGRPGPGSPAETYQRVTFSGTFRPRPLPAFLFFGRR